MVAPLVVMGIVAPKSTEVDSFLKSTARQDISSWTRLTSYLA